MCMFTSRCSFSVLIQKLFWFFCLFWDEFHSCHPGWSAAAWSQLSANSTSASWVQAILLVSTSQVVGTTDMRHHAQLIFVFFFSREGVSLYVGQAGLELNLKLSAHLHLPKCWDYRHKPPAWSELDSLIDETWECYTLYVVHYNLLY